VIDDASAAACGAVGQACCAAESATACGGNGFCMAGTCQECVTAIAPGRHASCLLKYDHTVWCAGENVNGQLGFGQTGMPVSSWMQARDATTGAVIDDATALESGFEFTCAVRAGGTVGCWGLNGNGNLGNNTTVNAAAAVQVQKTNGQPLTAIVEVGAGYSGACGRDSLGGVWCWGQNTKGQLGDGTIVTKHQAVQVLDAPMGAPMTGALALSVGGDHACVRKANNAIFCWGRNEQGQLGDTTAINRLVPVSVGTATSVATGQRHTCSVRLDGTVWCSGESWRNRIGNGANNYDAPSPGTYTTPVQVVVAPGGAGLAGATSVAAGGVSCVLLGDKTVQCWGDGPYGETGTGAGTSVPAPVVTADHQPLTGVDRILADSSHACAHRTDGQLLCWGRNLEGQLGDGTFENRGVATPVGFTCP
jgi:alpha-tubulin suppressor-like RCC1 family protein